MVPLLLRGYALPQLTANATALLPNVATCAAGGTVFTLASPEHVDIPAAVFAAVAASLVAPRAARFAHLLPARIQKLLFAGCMLLSAPCVVYKAEISNWLLKNNNSRPDKEPPAPLHQVRPFSSFHLVPTPLITCYWAVPSVELQGYLGLAPVQ